MEVEEPLLRADLRILPPSVPPPPAGAGAGVLVLPALPLVLPSWLGRGEGEGGALLDSRLEQRTGSEDSLGLGTNTFSIFLQ